MTYSTGLKQYHEKMKIGKRAKMDALREMAEIGEGRPPVGTALGRAVAAYTCPTSGAYEADFTAHLRDIRPDWFGRGGSRPTADRRPAEAIKQDLIRLALAKETVRTGHPLYLRLRAYTSRKSEKYDAEFTRLIMLLAPDWSVKSGGKTGNADSNKQAIMLAAEAGWDKPSRQTKMGQVLSTYASVNHESYDGLFLARLMKLRPDWFAAPQALPQAA